MLMSNSGDVVVGPPEGLHQKSEHTANITARTDIFVPSVVNANNGYPSLTHAHACSK